MSLLSVVVPTYNRLPRLRQVIAGLERQQFPRERFEVVVVSDGSSDGTHEYLGAIRTPLALRFVPQANQGPAAARNTGFRQASGAYVLFIDDDVVPTPQLLAEHMRLHDGQADLVVLGPMLDPPDARLLPWVAWEQAMLMKQYEAMVRGDWEPTARQFYTGNTSLARAHLLASGGFDARFRRAEDVELGYRLHARGLRFVFNPQAVGHHYAERSFRSWLETPYAYGRNDVIFSRESQRWLLDTIAGEFAGRNLLTRALVRACLNRPRASQLTQAALAGSGALFGRLGARRGAQAAYSAIFNLRYYQGVADELAGPQPAGAALPAFLGGRRP
jgi:GT2 family glycosyltransferase